MNKEMFPQEGNWYKGNLHCHSTRSDGALTPQEVTAYYKSHGYSFLCMSEHDLFSDMRGQFDSEDFIILPGVEASAWLVDENLHRLKSHHIHGILGTQQMQRDAALPLYKDGDKLGMRVYFGSWDGLAAAQALSDELRARGCFTTYNHPDWSRVEMDEVTGLEGIWAMEVYNYDTVIECGEGYDHVFWDAMLRKGSKVLGFASDDNHNHERLADSFGGFVMVKSEQLSHEAIVRHLLAGDYYFSSGGPQISSWGRRGNEIYIQCAGADHINFICGGGVGLSETISAKGELLREASHMLSGSETYARVECVGEDGKTAWTNPVWL